MTAMVARFLRDSSGSTALEYAVIGSIISVAVVVAAASIGSKLGDMFAAIVPHL